MLRFYIAILSLFLFVSSGIGQSENSAYSLTGRAGAATAFAKDYQTIGINPANLGFLSEYEGKKVTIGVGEGTFGFYSKALNNSQLFDAVLDFGATKFTYNQKKEAAKLFAESPIYLDINYMLVGASVQIDKIGGFAFSVRDKINVYAVFSDNASELLFMGRASTQFFNTLEYKSLPGLSSTFFPNGPPSNGYSQDTLNNIVSGISTAPGTISKALNNSYLDAQWTREFNFSYGNKVIKVDAFELYAGIGVRYIMGYAAIHLDAKNNSFNDSYASFSPGMNVKIGRPGENNPTAISGNILTPTGQGFGLDLGLSMKYYGLTFGAALVNMGSMTWDKNMYLPKDTVMQSLTGIGLQNYNILTQTEQFTSDQSAIKWRSAQAVNTALPGLFRLGLNYNHKDFVQVGADLLLPTNKVNGSLQKMQFSFGADLKAAKWIKFSTGFTTGGNFGSKINIPFGITFIVGMNGFYEFGFATRDISTFLGKDNAHASFAAGFLRFRF